LAVPLLSVAVIQSSFRTLLVTPIGAATLVAACLFAAGKTAIAVPPVTVGADEEYRPAVRGCTKPLPKNHFPVLRHVSRQAAVDIGSGFVATLNQPWFVA
jgi:hypothetical protein